MYLKTSFIQWRIYLSFNSLSQPITKKNKIESKVTNIQMALLASTLFNTKNGHVPLTNKLNDDNFHTWKKSVILTLRTLKLQDHFSSDKIPPPFEAVPTPEADSGYVNKGSGVDSDPKCSSKENNHCHSSNLARIG
ncbi:hypothetical protein PIB30_057043 [Stylosanthes scabra]|uniref:Retrotransposon Copia-like N-terminal domain-containing protein n=1 Tax=Stylosanthes scabra TaxID=79078 RepID=A0ABU6VKM2_9FABA|nr:hypothetical protein [Stylosanthes scabra]